MYKLAPALPKIQWFCEQNVGKMHGHASQATSTITLRFCQSLLGPFVGYQLCLDLAVICRGWFSCNEVCEVGPGAVEMLAKCCDSLPDCLGMADKSDGRVYQLACVPIAFHLQKMGHTHPAAKTLRSVCKKLRVPLSTVKDWQYHC